MMQKTDNVYTSTLLTSLNIFHGYSSRSFGDMRNYDSRKKLLQDKSDTLIVAEQVHGIRIKKVNDADQGREMKGYDGLVGKSGTLGVTFADCVPILAVDPKAGIIGTAHAGWKGTLSGIAKELIFSMNAEGAHTKDIYISVGPHIGMCCYNVPEDRALMFQNIFGSQDKIITRILGQWHLDIGYANFMLLLETGISRDHIDAPPMCTSCQVATFNSYRKDPKDRFGLQLGVISL